MSALTQGRWSGLPVDGCQQYLAGTTVYRQGDAGDALYLIETGGVKLVRAEAGGSSAIAALRFPGWLVGIAAAVLEVPHELTAVTVGSCELRRVTAAAFRQAKARDARLAAAVERALAEDIHHQVVRIGRSSMDARSRLLGVLRDLAGACGRTHVDGSIRLEINLTHAEFAGLIFTTREHVSHLFSALAAEGRVRRERGWLVLPAGRPQASRRGPLSVK